MNRRRDNLHHTKAQEFIQWAEARGYVRQPTKSMYEVFRLHNAKKGEILIAHLRDRSDHVTTTGRLTSLVANWMKEKRDCVTIRDVIE